jgi:hypothetical protein
MNGQKNKKFLNSLSHESGLKNLILTNIADHYRIDIIKAYEEVIDEDAEHILEYVTGDTRPLTMLLVKYIGY